MTDTEAKALALVNDVEGGPVNRHLAFKRTSNSTAEALCRTIERLEATEARHAAELREQAERFSEVARSALTEALKADTYANERAAIIGQILAPFILPKPDPLEDVLSEAGYAVFPDDLERVRAALAARGYEVRKIGEAGE